MLQLFDERLVRLFAMLSLGVMLRARCALSSMSHLFASIVSESVGALEWGASERPTASAVSRRTVESRQPFFRELRMSSFRSALLALAVASVGCKTSGGPAPAPAESGAFVVTLGNDTVAVDQYTRVGDRIEGSFMQRAPRTIVTKYVITLNPSGMPSLYEVTQRQPDGGLVPPNNVRHATVTFTGDSAITQIQRDTLVTRRVAARGAFPFINFAVSMYALPIAALRAANRDSAMYAIIGAGGANPTPMAVVRKGPNRYWMILGPFATEVTTDDRGRVQTADGARTTQHILTRRQASADVSAFAAMFASRGGILSPRDTVNATVGSAQLWVDYSRPLARGRRVFSTNGVLGDTIWRTGANAATQFRTTAPLTIAGQTVPAGTYTLWTLAVPGRYQLIFNKQVGQWGTEYRAEQDLIRAPLQATQLPQTVDRFTIAVDPAGGNAGVLRLRWDTTELALPFTTP
jgi:hypothetical protein